MDCKLTREEVLHVMDLARLSASDVEIEKYQVDLYKMIQEIDKIRELDDFDEDILIAPWSNDSHLRENEEISVPSDDILKNVPSKKGNFISVDVEVLKDE